MTSAKTLPDDRSCRVERGGCGRTIILVTERYSEPQHFGQMTVRRAGRLKAIHEDDFDPTKQTKVARPKPEGYRKHRCNLEELCAEARNPPSAD